MFVDFSLFKTLRNERRLCENSVHTLYEQRRITAPKYYGSEAQPSSQYERVFRVQQFSEIISYSNTAECSNHGKTMFINNKSTILYTWHVKTNV